MLSPASTRPAGPRRNGTVITNQTNYRAHGLPGLLSLVSRSVYHFWNAAQRQLLMVLVHGMFHTVFTVAALFLLVPMVQSVSRGSSELVFGPLAIEASALVFALMLALSVILLGAGLRGDYRAHVLALEIQSRVTQKSIAMTLVALLRFPPERRTRRAVRELTGSVATSAGFTMRKVASGASAIVQVPLLYGVLLWVQTGLTIIATVAVIPLLLVYSRSVRRISATMRDRKFHGRKSRDDLLEIADLLQEPATTASDVEARARLLIDDSSLGKGVRLQESIRRERRWGPTTVASAFPLLLAILAVAAYVFDMFAGSIEWILVYVMVLRSLVGLVQELSSSMIAVARFHDNLVCLFDLLAGVPAPHCGFLDTANERADDAETEDEEDV